jgi:hypothetical protein
MGASTEIHGTWGVTIAAALALAGGAAIGGAAAAQAGAIAADGMPPCLQCIAVRLEHPVVVRGPSPHEPDAPVSVIKLPDGGFRGFVAGGTTLAIDGATPVALGGPSQVVLKPGPPGSQSDCGRWITAAMQGLGVIYGLIHNETHCDDPHGSYKTMSIGQSADHGLTWNDLGQIIVSDDAAAPHSEGEGDCTALDGHDGYWYAYCLRRRDGKNIVARAPIENPAPGQWKEWSGRGWNAPGLGGTGAALAGFVGMSSAYWTDHDVVLLLADNSSLRLSMSEDKVHFATVAEPLVLYDEDNWQRPTASELYAYPSMVADRGFNNIADHFFLTYMYVPPGEDFSQRYLVAQEGWISSSDLPQSPQVRTALSRWIDADGDTWTTTGPTIASGHSYIHDADLGYLMTAEPQQSPGLKLDECFSAASGFLAAAGQCAAEGSERRRPAGYVFRSEQPGTIALYDCRAESNSDFVSRSPDCENKGMRRRLLGFALR